jgi:hypothetical protein
MERPDEGTVLFAGRDLARHRDMVLGSEIGCAQFHFSPGEPGSVLDQVADGLLAGRPSIPMARRRARETLADVGAEHYPGPSEVVHAIDGVSLTVAPGEILAVRAQWVW